MKKISFMFANSLLKEQQQLSKVREALQLLSSSITHRADEGESKNIKKVEQEVSAAIYFAARNSTESLAHQNGIELMQTTEGIRLRKFVAVLAQNYAQDGATFSKHWSSALEADINSREPALSIDRIHQIAEDVGQFVQQIKEIETRGPLDVELFKKMVVTVDEEEEFMFTIGRFYLYREYHLRALELALQLMDYDDCKLHAMRGCSAALREFGSHHGVKIKSDDGEGMLLYFLRDKHYPDPDSQQHRAVKEVFRKWLSAPTLDDYRRIYTKSDAESQLDALLKLFSFLDELEERPHSLPVDEFKKFAEEILKETSYFGELSRNIDFGPNCGSHVDDNNEK